MTVSFKTEYKFIDFIYLKHLSFYQLIRQNKTIWHKNFGVLI